jgi:hypothetical protein
MDTAQMINQMEHTSFRIQQQLKEQRQRMQEYSLDYSQSLATTVQKIKDGDVQLERKLICLLRGRQMISF